MHNHPHVQLPQPIQIIDVHSYLCESTERPLPRLMYPYRNSQILESIKNGTHIIYGVIHTIKRGDPHEYFARMDMVDRQNILVNLEQRLKISVANEALYAEIDRFGRERYIANHGGDCKNPNVPYPYPNMSENKIVNIIDTVVGRRRM